MYIAIEGIEGSGKTSIVRELESALKKRSKKIKIRLIKEPGTTEIAQEIRQLLFNHEMSGRTELFLFMAARSSLLEEIQDSDDDYIISDRSLYSSLALQSKDCDDLERLYCIHHHFFKNEFPEVAFFIDLAPEKALRRKMKEQPEEINRFELKGIGFHEAVYGRYQHMIDQGYLVWIDGEQSIKAIADAILKHLDDRDINDLLSNF